jgi:hypothetical protein
MKKLSFIFAFFLLSFNIFAQPTISLTQVASGLSQPMQVVHAGDGSNRIFIPQKGGDINVGGTVYRGQTYTSLKGYYLCTDFYSGQLFKVKYDSLTNTYNTSSQNLSANGITDFGESEDGEMYITSLFSGNVFRVQSNGPIQYTFTGNGNWTDPTNWSNNTIPPSNSLTGSIIAIRPMTGGQCIVNVPITIAVGTKIIIDNNKVLRMNNNLVIQ